MIVVRSFRLRGNIRRPNPIKLIIQLDSFVCRNCPLIAQLSRIVVDANADWCCMQAACGSGL